MVRAKFKVESTQPRDQVLPGGDVVHEGGTVTLRPVYSGSPENDQFYKLTPSGQIVLSTINVAAFEQFTEGQEFYVDFTPAGS